MLLLADSYCSIFSSPKKELRKAYLELRVKTYSHYYENVKDESLNTKYLVLIVEKIFGGGY
ncbi:hypothetical protein HI914_05339 [Erysiphe necator]|nr:hypothetical protein HI914_05339 [Erysiphe necator]